MLGQLSNLISLADQGLYDKLIPTIRTGNARLNPSNIDGSSLASDSDRDSFSVFTSLLKQSYRKMMFNPQNIENSKSFESQSRAVKPAIDNYATSPSSNEKISSREAAGNILKFITQRLKADFADGADAEKLLSRLNAGLEGFEKGFNEAKQQIEGLGLLTQDLEDEIADTYRLVTQGIKKLRDVINSKDADSYELENGVIESAAGAISSLSSSQSGSLQADGFKESNFSLQLTTNDGDIVTINVNQIQQASLSTSYNNDENLATNSRSQSDSFAISVKGELDEGELNAINQLLEEVNAIASDFYKGNLEQAFNSAKTLNLNQQELSSLNLELKQTVAVKAIASYQSSQPNELLSTDSITKEGDRSLRDLLDSVEKIIEHARVFANPFELLENLVNELKPLESLRTNNNQGELIQSIKDLSSQFDI